MMSLIRSVQGFQGLQSLQSLKKGCCSYARPFSLSSISYALSSFRKSAHQSKKTGFGKANALQRPKGSGSKRRLLEKRKDVSPVNIRGSGINKKDQKDPEKLGYGEFSSLKTITQNDYNYSKNLIEKIDDFKALKLLHPVRDAIVESIKKNSILNSTNYVSPNKYERPKDDQEEITVKPSPIQIAAIKILSKYILKPQLSTFTIAAETGSGKTWAYMAPLIDYLKHEETSEAWERMKNKAIVRSVILLPTHELVDQVYQSAQDVYSKLDLNVCKWDTGTTHQDFANTLKKRIDILITTPGKVNSLDKIRIISNPHHVFARTGFLVVDEADTLMDRSWINDTCRSIRKLQNLSNLVFCSATIPREFNVTIEKLFPNAIPITTPSLHKLPKTIKFTLIDSRVSPYQGSKTKALAQALYAIHRDGTEPGFEKRVVVFVNEKKEVDKIADVLRDTYNHDVTTLTGEDTAEERSEKVSLFIRPPRRLSEINKEEIQVVDNTQSSKQQTYQGSNISLPNKKEKTQAETEGSLKVLIATDVLARGLNFSAVRNVILYDVPNTSADLVHRAGRTGRMNQSGRVFLIIDKSSKSWVKKLPTTIRNHGLIT